MPVYDPATRFRLMLPLTGLLLVAGCAVNPATGQRQFSLISEAREIDMGREADRSISASLGLYESEELQAFVLRLGNELAQLSERPRSSTSRRSSRPSACGSGTSWPSCRSARACPGRSSWSTILR